jgi:hypothetical protein
VCFIFALHNPVPQHNLVHLVFWCFVLRLQVATKTVYGCVTIPGGDLRALLRAERWTGRHCKRLVSLVIVNMMNKKRSRSCHVACLCQPVMRYITGKEQDIGLLGIPNSTYSSHRTVGSRLYSKGVANCPAADGCAQCLLLDQPHSTLVTQMAKPGAAQPKPKPGTAMLAWGCSGPLKAP